jgi:hypothetical protein
VPYGKNGRRRGSFLRLDLLALGRLGRIGPQSLTSEQPRTLERGESPRGVER